MQFLCNYQAGNGYLVSICDTIIYNCQYSNLSLRRVPQGVLSILEGFNFNRDTSLQDVFRTPYSTILDRDSMLATISIPSLIPQAMIDTASGANAFMLTIFSLDPILRQLEMSHFCDNSLYPWGIPVFVSFLLPPTPPESHSSGSFHHQT